MPKKKPKKSGKAIAIAKGLADVATLGLSGMVMAGKSASKGAKKAVRGSKMAASKMAAEKPRVPSYPQTAAQRGAAARAKPKKPYPTMGPKKRPKKKP